MNSMKRNKINRCDSCYKNKQPYDEFVNRKQMALAAYHRGEIDETEYVEGLRRLYINEIAAAKEDTQRYIEALEEGFKATCGGELNER